MIEFKLGKIAEVIKTSAKHVEAMTKQLKIQKVSKQGNKRKLVISTNWLKLFNFKEGQHIVEEVSQDRQGLIIRHATLEDTQVKKVYGRDYSNRSERETVMNIRHQGKIDEALGESEYAHITMMSNMIIIVPMKEHQQNITDESGYIAITRNPENGLYDGITQTIEVIKKRAFCQITIQSDDAFLSSQEKALIEIQLRRMGYQVSVSEDGDLHAIANTANTLKRESNRQAKVDIARYFDNTPPDIGRDIINKGFDFSNPFSVFGICTSGVDLYAMQSEGFQANQLLEWRPPEKRDFTIKVNQQTGEKEIKHNDKSETGAICASINNTKIKTVFNEDVYRFKEKYVEHLLSKSNTMVVSAQCDDFSCLKSLKNREESVQSLDTTRDMIFPILDRIIAFKPSNVVLENVRNFANSTECQLFVARLKQLGYFVKTAVMNAAEHGGYTTRVRCFVWASSLSDNMIFPEKIESSKHLYNDIVEPNLDMLRDISHTKTVAKAIETGRIRAIEKGARFGCTLTKSQPRQAKDSAIFHIDGKYYLPNNDMLKMMMGMSEAFDTSMLSGEVTSEVIGQGIDVPMHTRISKRVKANIEQFCGSLKVAKVSLSITSKAIMDKVKTPIFNAPQEQLTLF